MTLTGSVPQGHCFLTCTTLASGLTPGASASSQLRPILYPTLPTISGHWASLALVAEGGWVAASGGLCPSGMGHGLGHRAFRAGQTSGTPVWPKDQSTPKPGALGLRLCQALEWQCLGLAKPVIQGSDTVRQQVPWTSSPFPERSGGSEVLVGGPRLWAWSRENHMFSVTQRQSAEGWVGPEVGRFDRRARHKV